MDAGSAARHATAAEKRGPGSWEVIGIQALMAMPALLLSDVRHRARVLTSDSSPSLFADLDSTSDRYRVRTLPAVY